MFFQKLTIWRYRNC